MKSLTPSPALTENLRTDLMHVASVFQNKADAITTAMTAPSVRKELVQLVNDLFLLIEVIESAPDEYEAARQRSPQTLGDDTGANVPDVHRRVLPHAPVAPTPPPICGLQYERYGHMNTCNKTLGHTGPHRRVTRR